MDAKEVCDLAVKAGIFKIRLEFSGSGDEGYVTGALAAKADDKWSSMDNYEDWETVGDDLLQSHFPSWQDDDGGRGHITIDPLARTYKIEMAYYVTTTEDQPLAEGKLE